MLQYTKEEWSINTYDPSRDISIGAKGTPKIATILLRDVSINEQKGNAKLIVNAPKLFETLEELIRLKDWKDRNGKDEIYVRSQPIAWENARNVINEINKD